MKFKFSVALYEVLLSDSSSLLYLAAEVKEYSRSSELNLHKQESSDIQFYGDFPVLFFYVLRTLLQMLAQHTKS